MTAPIAAADMAVTSSSSSSSSSSSLLFIQSSGDAQAHSRLTITITATLFADPMETSSSSDADEEQWHSAQPGPAGQEARADSGEPLTFDWRYLQDAPAHIAASTLHAAGACRPGFF
jgi:hypothetical protein